MFIYHVISFSTGAILRPFVWWSHSGWKYLTHSGASHSHQRQQSSEIPHTSLPKFVSFSQTNECTFCHEAYYHCYRLLGSVSALSPPAVQTWLRYVRIDLQAVRLVSLSEREQVETLDNYWHLISQLCTCRAPLSLLTQSGGWWNHSDHPSVPANHDALPFAFEILLWQFAVFSRSHNLNLCCGSYSYCLVLFDHFQWYLYMHNIHCIFKKILYKY